MAQKDGEVNQEKVKADAQKIAAGDKTPEQVKAPEGVKESAAAGHATNPGLTGNNAAGAPQSLNPEHRTPPASGITQGNPGALKPGEVAAQKSATKAQAEPLQEEEDERVHNDLVKQFGPDYVVARKEGTGDVETMTTTFSRRAWDLLGPNKEGWKPLAKEPKEVTDLKNRKAAEGAK